MDSTTDPDNLNTSTSDGESTPPTSTNNQQSVDWEKRYVGLQQASEKKRTQLESEISNIKQNYDKAIAELEELRTSTTDLEKIKTATEEAKNKAETDLQALIAERDALSKQIAMKDLLIKEYPDLVPVIGFIPAADDEEKLRQYAAEFSTALKTYVERGVKTALEGSSPPTTGGTTTLPTEEESDRLYRAVERLAGVPGKENEYREALSAWEKFMATKNA